MSSRPFCFLLRVSNLGQSSAFHRFAITLATTRCLSNRCEKWPERFVSGSNLVWRSNGNREAQEPGVRAMGYVSKESRNKQDGRKVTSGRGKLKDNSTIVQPPAQDLGGSRQLPISKVWLAPAVRGPAAWPVTWTRKLSYQNLTLAAASSELSRRSRFRKAFTRAVSIEGLFDTLQKLPKQERTDFDYIAFLNELCQRTDFGRHKNTKILYREPAGVRNQFYQLVRKFCFRNPQGSSELVWAVSIGSLHILGAGAFLKFTNIRQMADRLPQVSLDSKVVLLDALSNVANQRKGRHHLKLLLDVVHEIHLQMFPNRKNEDGELRRRLRHHNNEHLVVAARALARSRCYTLYIWRAICKGFIHGYFSFLPGEIGELACAVGFAKVDPHSTGMFFKSLAQVCEDDVHKFSFVDRVDVVWAGLLNNGRFVPNSIHALLSEALLLDWRFIRRHPYKAVFLHDILSYISLVHPALINSHTNLISLHHYLRLFKLVLTLNDHLQPSTRVQELTSSLLSAHPDESESSSCRYSAEENLPFSHVLSFGENAVRDLQYAPADPAVDTGERLDSVWFDVNVDGVCVSVAILADMEGNLVPWTSVEASLGGEPQLWSQYKKTARVQDVSSAEDIEFSGSATNEKFSSDGDEDGERFGISDLPHGKEFGWRKKRLLRGGDDQDELVDEALHLEEKDLAVDEILSSFGRWPKYIDFPKEIIMSLQLRPIAIQILNRNRCGLWPHRDNQFHGSIKMQKVLLEVGGWRVIQLCEDDVSDELDSVKVEALLHFLLSKHLSLASRSDLLEHVPKKVVARYTEGSDASESAQPAEETEKEIGGSSDEADDQKLLDGKKVAKDVAVKKEEAKLKKTGRHSKSKFGHRKFGVSVRVKVPDVANTEDAQ